MICRRGVVENCVTLSKDYPWPIKRILESFRKYNPLHSRTVRVSFDRLKLLEDRSGPKGARPRVFSGMHQNVHLQPNKQGCDRLFSGKFRYYYCLL